jgi:hypothetical protein
VSGGFCGAAVPAVPSVGRGRWTPSRAACNVTPGRPNIAAMENAMLTPDLAARFMRVALGHVTREFRNMPRQV